MVGVTVVQIVANAVTASAVVSALNEAAKASIDPGNFTDAL